MVRWLREIVEALDYIHQRHLVHRDVKPLNVFITKQGQMKLGDFGLASSTNRNKTLSQVFAPPIWGSLCAPRRVGKERQTARVRSVSSLTVPVCRPSHLSSFIPGLHGPVPRCLASVGVGLRQASSEWVREGGREEGRWGMIGEGRGGGGRE